MSNILQIYMERKRKDKIKNKIMGSQLKKLIDLMNFFGII
jgi:hypothetical protein